MNNNRNIHINFSFLEILLIVNIILKLTETITWNWWLVLWPLWTSIILFIIAVIIVYKHLED